MSDYKIFTEEEFKQRVKLFWDLMIKTEFASQDTYIIKFKNNDNFGSWCWNDKRELAFGRGLLYGRYALWFVDDVIKHEIGHVLDYMRNGFKTRKKKVRGGYSWDMHGAHYKKISTEFDFCPQSRKSTSNLCKNGIPAENPDYKEDLRMYKYFLVCKCGYERKAIRKKGIMSRMYRDKSTKLQMACPNCKRDDSFTLYHFPKGIESGTEVNYEAYYNMFGGIKIV